MKKSEKNRIAEKLAAYPLGMLQDFITFTKLCRQENVKIESIIAYIRQRYDDSSHFKRMAQHEQIYMDRMIQEKFPLCPVCQNRLMLEQINDDLARVIDDHSNSWWICPDVTCTHEPETSDKYPYEILSDMGIFIRKRYKPPLTRRKEAARKQLSGAKEG